MKAISLLLLLSACSTYTPTGDPIRDALARRQRQLTQCYMESDSYKGPHHKEQGKITAGFTLDAEGKVRAERILSSDFKDANLHVCVLGIIESTPFEKPKDGRAIEVTQPISFYK